MRLVLLGAPGSGKGTQAKSLVERYKVPQISTGDLLRNAVSAGSDLGRKAKEYMDAGQLVPDSLVLSMIRERLAQSDATGGFILDGFPRNQSQAEALDKLLTEMNQPLDLALLIDVDYDILMQRLTGRLTCESCGAVFNIYTNPPSLDDECDNCGGDLHHRADDNEETIGNRLRVYDAQTRPLIAYYGGSDRLDTINGEGDIKDIFANMTASIDRSIAGAEPKLAAPKPEERLPEPEAKPKLPEPEPTPRIEEAKPAPKAEQSPAPAPEEKPAAEAKPEVKKAPAKKAAAKKAPAKKAAAKKAVTKKAPAKKKVAAPKKTVKKAATKKTAKKKRAAAKPLSHEAVQRLTDKLLDRETKAVEKFKTMSAKAVDQASDRLAKAEAKWEKRITAAEARIEKLQDGIMKASSGKKASTRKKKSLIGRLADRVGGKKPKKTTKKKRR